MSPYPNEHACRLADPADVKVVGSITKRHNGKPFRILVGLRKGKAGSEAQAYRYPVGSWTPAEAREHCKEAGGSFEQATKAQEMTAEEITGPENPMIPEMEDPGDLELPRRGK